VPSGATFIKGLPSGVLNAATTRPTGVAGTVMSVQSPVVGGKQTIVIASPRPNLPGAPPAKLLTAMPRGVPGTPGAQYIVVTTRPGGGTVGTSSALTVSPAAGTQRVISKCRLVSMILHG